jgi:ammonia channel protein AmtB
VCLLTILNLTTGDEIVYFYDFNRHPLVGAVMLDFSGTGAIRLTGGFTALLYATILVDPRRGKFCFIPAVAAGIPWALTS